MCQPDPDGSTPSRHVAERYARDVLALHDNLSFRGLLGAATAARSVHRAVRPDGLVTLALRSDDLDPRQLMGLHGFRLAQYLRLGWACREVVHDRAMFCEPPHAASPDDLHVLTLSGTGRILGYVALVGSGDPAPTLMSDPARRRFPVEVAHDLDLPALVPLPADLLTSDVRELKRFVHDQSLADRALRLRITFELLLGAGSALLRTDPPVRLFVGDVEEHVALRHLVLAGLDVRLVEGTAPVLPNSDYLHLAYVKRAAVKPFVAELPTPGELARRIAELEGVLAAPDLFAAATALPSSMPGTVERRAA